MELVGSTLSLDCTTQVGSGKFRMMVTILGIMEEKDTTSHARIHSQVSQGDTVADSWDHYWDETEGMWYSYNAETGETKWDEDYSAHEVLSAAEQQETDAKIDSLFSVTDAVAEPKWDT